MDHLSFNITYKQETLTPPGHLVSPLVCRGPWMSTVVLYCWCHSDGASVLLYFTLQVHRWWHCIVHKQPRIWKWSGPDKSCWTWDQGHYRDHHFRLLPRFTTVDWGGGGWSTAHFHLPQRDDLNFHITKLPFLRSNFPYECFILKARLLSSKLLKQGYLVEF